MFPGIIAMGCVIHTKSIIVLIVRPEVDPRARAAAGGFSGLFYTNKYQLF